MRRWLSAISVPAAAAAGLLAHGVLANQGPAAPTRIYPGLLVALLVAGVVAEAGQVRFARLRKWVCDRGPLLAAALLTVCAWEVVTIKLGLLPLMYFPPPEKILEALVDDWRQLLDSAFHSLLLLVTGYLAGAVAGIGTGIAIGWSGRARYWGLPLLKILGPIPATAWIPMALILFPQSNAAGIFLIALAVWFPVAMLTASGIANVRERLIDVARTLGAGRWFLIFRVAVPAAMPTIFIGLFMGLGVSFLTLLVAESTGVSSGLGWYIDWARNYSNYDKVFAALVIMAAFFSTIMTGLFSLRDRVLVWQKGVIRW